MAGVALDQLKQIGRLFARQHSPDAILWNASGSLRIERVSLFEHRADAEPVHCSTLPGCHQGTRRDNCHTGEPGVTLVREPIEGHANTVRWHGREVDSP